MKPLRTRRKPVEIIKEELEEHEVCEECGGFVISNTCYCYDYSKDGEVVAQYDIQNRLLHLEIAVQKLQEE